jgi:hypothetical protein
MAAAKNNQMLTADEANNRANAKSPDSLPISWPRTWPPVKQGAAGTMLTGPGGVDPNRSRSARTAARGRLMRRPPATIWPRSAATCCAGWGELKLERASWMPHWQELSRSCCRAPGATSCRTATSGGRRHNNIYDNTGTRAARVLAAGMMSGMTSPARPWFRLKTPDKS